MRRGFVVLLILVLAGLALSPVIAALPAAEQALQNGFTYLIIGLNDMAARTFDKAVKLDPDNADAYLARAMLSLAEGDGQEAVDDFRAAVDAGGKDLEFVHAMIGDVYRQSGDYSRAKAEYEKALAIEPEAARALYGLAIVEEDAGNTDRAIDLYEKAVEVAPDLADAYCRVGRLLRATGQLESARELLEKGVLYNSRHAGVHFELGMIYSALGERDKAYHEFDRTLQLDSDHSGAREKLNEY